MEPKVRGVPQELYVNNRFGVCGLDSLVFDCTMIIVNNGEKFRSVRNNYVSNNFPHNGKNVFRIFDLGKLEKSGEIIVNFFDRFYDDPSEQMVVGDKLS